MITKTKKLNLSRHELTLGRTIRSIRLCDEVKQIDFATTLGVTQSYLSDLECDRKEISPQKAGQFAEILGYSKKQFIRLALQDSLRRKGLYYSIDLKEAV